MKPLFRLIQGVGGRGGNARPPYFLQSLVFFAITLKNKKQCYLKLNWSLIMHLQHTFTQILSKHVQLAIICYLADSYPTNTAHVFHVVTNLTVLTSTTDKIKGISNHLWDRWRHEYVVNLRETQRTSKWNI